MTEIVVSGLGVVFSHGAGRDDLREALAFGAPRLSEIDRGDGYHLASGARCGALVDAAAYRPWLSPREARRMSPPSRFAVAAARIAFEDSGSEPAAGPDDGTMVALATAYGPSSYTERMLKQVMLEGPINASPTLFTESVANAPAAQIALYAHATGANFTVTQREAGDLQAIRLGVRELGKGRAQRALVGGVDELNPLLHAVLARHHALAHDRGSEELARPFDVSRNGFTVGEGAAVAILESSDAVRSRGSEPSAVVLGGGCAFDPTAEPGGWGSDGELVGRIIKTQMGKVGVEPEAIDAVVCSASGSRAGDPAVANVLGGLFGEIPGKAGPPLITPTAVIGVWSGAIMATAVLAAGGCEIARPVGFVSADPELGIVPWAGAVSPGRVLALEVAVGGATSWLVLDGRETGDA